MSSSVSRTSKSHPRKARFDPFDLRLPLAVRTETAQKRRRRCEPLDESGLSRPDFRAPEVFETEQVPRLLVGQEIERVTSELCAMTSKRSQLAGSTCTHVECECGWRSRRAERIGIRHTQD